MARWFYIKDDIFTCVDDAAYDRFSGRLWSLASGGYAGTKAGPGIAAYLLHRLVIGAAKGQLVDHINGDKMDNRLANLRIVTRAENAHNSTKSGVHFHSRDRKWVANISGKWIGYFPTKEAAEVAYRDASLARSGCSFFARPSEASPKPSDVEKSAAMAWRMALEKDVEERRIALSLKARARPVVNDKGEQFPSGLAAARHYGVPNSSIRSCCIGKGRQAGGMTWRFVDAIGHNGG